MQCSHIVRSIHYHTYRMGSQGKAHCSHPSMWYLLEYSSNNSTYPTAAQRKRSSGGTNHGNDRWTGTGTNLNVTSDQRCLFCIRSQRQRHLLAVFWSAVFSLEQYWMVNASPLSTSNTMAKMALNRNLIPEFPIAMRGTVLPRFSSLIYDTRLVSHPKVRIKRLMSEAVDFCSEDRGFRVPNGQGQCNEKRVMEM